MGYGLARRVSGLASPVLFEKVAGAAFAACSRVAAGEETRMYRLVASDMDETFLAHDHSIPKANVDAIRRMRELGVLFVPASGRSYASVVESFSSAPADLLDGTYVISFNGGTINRVGDPCPIESSSLPETVRDLFGRARPLAWAFTSISATALYGRQSARG